MELAAIAYIAIMSLVLCVFMYIDKKRAIKNEWRIAEKTLFTLAICGGRPRNAGDEQRLQIGACGVKSRWQRCSRRGRSRGSAPWREWGRCSWTVLRHGTVRGPASRESDVTRSIVVPRTLETSLPMGTIMQL